MSSNFAYRYVSLTPEHTTSSGARSYGTASAGSDAELFGEVDDESFAHMFDLLYSLGHEPLRCEQIAKR